MRPRTDPETKHAERVAERKALQEERRKRRGQFTDLDRARDEAVKITNPARQKLMLEVIDDLERARERNRIDRETRLRMRAREEHIAGKETRIVTDDDAREWIIPEGTPNGTLMYDPESTCTYKLVENHLVKILDGPPLPPA